MADKGRSFKLADVFKHKTLSDVTATPDGRGAAFTVTRQDLKENKHFSDVWAWGEGRGVWQVTFGGKARQPSLSPRGDRLAFVSRRDGGKAQVVVMGANFSEGRPVTEFKNGVVKFNWSPDGRRLAVLAVADKTPDEKKKEEEKRDWWTRDADERRRTLWSVSARGAGKPRRLSTPDEHVSSAAWTPDCKHVVYTACPIGTIDSQWFESELKIVDAKGRRRRTICPTRGHSMEGRLSVSPDGKSILICEAYDERDLFHTVPKLVDLASGRKRLVAPKFDLQGVNAQLLPDGRVFFQSGLGTTLTFHVCKPGGRPQHLASGPGVASQAAVAREALRAFYVYSEAQKPDELYMRTLDDAAEAVALSNLNRAMSNVALARAEVVRWRSEGRDVEGMLYMPSKRGARKPYPLILMPHGGPYSASVNSYAAATSPNIFCAAGYACFLPNFRGSTGYGRAFTRGIIRNWGKGPFTDIMAGVDALIRRGIVDRKRMAVFGGSFGGYMTAWTIGHTRRFRCAVAVAAVVNNLSMYGTTDIPTFQFYSSGRRIPNFTDLYWREQSPLYHAGRIKTPTLIITGEVDKRVPPGQSGELYRALKARGVETQLVYYPREPHGISELRHRLHYFKQILDWINDHTLGRK